jgi:periplasmic divalent cation tolerance protein
MTDDATDEVRLVLTTAPDPAVAESIAAQLLHERLIACANVVPGVRSVYRWQGEVRKEDEVLLMLKSTGAAIGRLEQRLQQLHPYEVPEVLALEVQHGLEAYMAWVRSEVEVGHE